MLESAERLLYRSMLSIKGHRLDSMDPSRSKPDPFAVVKTLDESSGEWITIGKTARLEDTRDPDFKKSFVLPYDRDQESLLVRVEFYDFISSREKTLIGSAEYNLFKVLDSDHGGVRVTLSNKENVQPGEVTIIAKKVPLIAQCFYKLDGAPARTTVRLEYYMNASGDEDDVKWLLVDEKPNSKSARLNVMKLSLVPLTRDQLMKTQLRLSAHSDGSEIGHQVFPLSAFRSHMSDFVVPLGNVKATLKAKLGTLMEMLFEVKDLASRDTFGKSDPFVVVYMEMPEWTEMGRTETHFDASDCKFEETILVPFFPNDESTPVLVRVFDRDDPTDDLDAQELCGQVEVNLKEVANSPKEFELTGVEDECGKIIVSAI
eukprot:Plantae.Rhodophyta-Purpureofilum_apyrenoidigerum.ctg3746.p1 GENE.Plantae.Rhodophyta-Purpureofilum_apyrenoidigerum.ctg3746~~Plantae.Rhodophyta-Purpureofilum_apyrenoidigerum.ctg3746.p1  ORF type:complete len:374 (-),score=81.16 Plantae.Rhodophyta-Purpureofilum_apyrenoidigerum.ctg3746:1026-2147(-)